MFHTSVINMQNDQNAQLDLHLKFAKTPNIHHLHSKMRGDAHDNFIHIAVFVWKIKSPVAIDIFN